MARAKLDPVHWTPEALRELERRAQAGKLWFHGAQPYARFHPGTYRLCGTADGPTTRLDHWSCCWQLAPDHPGCKSVALEEVAADA